MPLTPAQIDDIRTRYAAGQSRAVIRRKTGFSLWAIEKFTHRMRKPHIVTNRVQERIIALAKQGLSARAVSKQVGFHDATVRLYGEGIFKQRRPAGRNVSRYSEIVEALETRATNETSNDVARRLGLKNGNTLRVMAHRGRALLAEARA
ncbi:hypothetical protein [Methylorubrum populi]|uniref:hypothetical protein n=1 Tax=Methylorubrum populi TaxID=223967 RepID=UPI00186B4E04|nr:hypothetical protein [Methylorubrum populi]